MKHDEYGRAMTAPDPLAPVREALQGIISRHDAYAKANNFEACHCEDCGPARVALAALDAAGATREDIQERLEYALAMEAQARSAAIGLADDKAVLSREVARLLDKINALSQHAAPLSAVVTREDVMNVADGLAGHHLTGPPDWLECRCEIHTKLARLAARLGPRRNE